ncbi:uncharacterized protein OCT59_022539 [Rhizophagus irregularis]|uniref:uncharacterized protein n=1 Tax=Rhizophagus irregularis TaxID=588596 RepID=UPI0033268B79|nr:hypothetical protein OCT59_022539 [Rhizophagus irregularis]
MRSFRKAKENISGEKQSKREKKQMLESAEQGLIREMISFKEENHVTEISATLSRPNNETSITIYSSEKWKYYESI